MRETAICVFGSRDINDYGEMVRIVLSLFKLLRIKPLEFISGEAKGKKGCPDQINNILSRRILGKDAIPFVPNWERYRRGAGKLRNKEMGEYLKMYQDCLAIGFWDTQSRGTENMMDLCNKFNIPLIIYNGNEFKKPL